MESKKQKEPSLRKRDMGQVKKETWQQTYLVLPDGKSVVQVNISASPSEFDTVAKRDNDLLCASIVPRLDKTNEAHVRVGARVSVSWEASDGMAQEVKHTTSHVFSGRNPAEWWLRLEGYLPLLPSIEKHEQSTTRQSEINIKTLSYSVIGIVKIYVWCKSNSKCYNDERRAFPISSGKIEVEGNEFPVSKELLAVHSEPFIVMFYGDFKEKGMEIITLEELSSTTFKSLLHIISTPGSTPKSVDAACNLHELANRYLMLGVRSRCTKYLLSVELNEKDAFMLMKYSDSRGYSDLLKHALDSFSSPSKLRDAFCPLAGTVSTDTTVVAFTHLSNMVTMKAISSLNHLKVWFDDPYSGKLIFELFFDRAPSIASSFVLLMGTGMDGDRRDQITVKSQIHEYTVNTKWREYVDGTTPRMESGWLLYTNNTYTFEITNESRTMGHFFGKLVEGQPVVHYVKYSRRGSRYSVPGGLLYQEAPVEASGLCSH